MKIKENTESRKPIWLSVLKHKAIKVYASIIGEDMQEVGDRMADEWLESKGQNVDNLTKGDV